MRIPFFTQRKNEPAVSVPPPASSNEPLTAVDAVMIYHESTKHHYHRFSRSLGYLDWDTQPDPFRRFEEAPLFRLPLLPVEVLPSYGQIFDPQHIAPQPVTIDSLSRLLRHSLAISAWKRYGQSHWSLRVNPSSGNLHPTEGYVIWTDPGLELSSGVYHYAPREHGLECRAILSHSDCLRLTEGFPPGTFFAGLSSIHWREAWKYGERAYRYCQHDCGHAIAALRFSAALLGWQVVLLDELSDRDIAVLLGLDRAGDFEEAEDEHPDVIAAVVPSKESLSTAAGISQETISQIATCQWRGRANRLSVDHVEWEIIDAAALHSTKPRTEIKAHAVPSSTLTRAPAEHLNMSAAKIIQQRRSAVALDGATSISAQTFYHMMSRVTPHLNPIPFDALVRSELGIPRVHLAIFVHRITGIDPGLYMLVRDPSKVSEIRGATLARFDWRRPPECPLNLDLYHLETGDRQRIAAGVSCGQDIAGDGAFSLGMIAEFQEPLQNLGAWLYRRLFWETGIIGQILYLEAEAAGIRATGIGCFFDDPMHETFGFQGRRFQSLYHFTMGGPVEDQRLTTEKAYMEMDRKPDSPE